ncbi:MAG: aminodeoxychorismate synthase component I [Bacteroidetes bacterium GWA2_31_9]|nr:MAG: aminodeoxychorismate synthase component I [Bacteroidetes bacterium GWA2_31_9]
MRIKIDFKIEYIAEFKLKLLKWAGFFEVSVYLDNNNYGNNSLGLHYNSFDCIVACGKQSELQSESDSFENLKNFYNEKKDWLFGHLSFDLKNQIENLQSNNFDGIQFPELYFFQPKYVITLSKNIATIHVFNNDDADKIFNEINFQIIVNQANNKVNFKARISKHEYIDKINTIKHHIQRGDIYELNFCQDFYSENSELNPVETFNCLNKISPTPFSCFYRNYDKYLLCASPERFLKKIGNKVISQPIKGTIKRGKNDEEDKLFAEYLKNNSKERSENIMITDLVRNDLSKTANRKSVRVEELCEVYTFNQVHQLISTISSEVSESVHLVDIIKSCFPMGSMTGAPKIRAMELIEEFEEFKRGLFSGSVGYITPDGDFDFNVVIRSILYNNTQKYISYMVGGAITINSDAENEYEECMIKAKAIIEVFSVNKKAD